MNNSNIFLEIISDITRLLVNTRACKRYNNVIFDKKQICKRYYNGKRLTKYYIIYH